MLAPVDRIRPYGRMPKTPSGSLKDSSTEAYAVSSRLRNRRESPKIRTWRAQNSRQSALAELGRSSIPGRSPNPHLGHMSNHLKSPNPHLGHTSNHLKSPNPRNVRPSTRQRSPKVERKAASHVDRSANPGYGQSSIVAISANLSFGQVSTAVELAISASCELSMDVRSPISAPWRVSRDRRLLGVGKGRSAPRITTKLWPQKLAWRRESRFREAYLPGRSGSGRYLGSHERPPPCSVVRLTNPFERLVERDSWKLGLCLARSRRWESVSLDVLHFVYKYVL